MIIGYKNIGVGNIHNKNNMLIFCMFFGLITILLILLISCLTMNVNADTEPPANGDWIIEEDEDAVLTDNHTMNGNVIINGTLTIDGNYSLEFDCDLTIQPPATPKAYGIAVNKIGKIILKNGAIIKALVPEDKDFRITQILIWGDADIQDSQIEGLLSGLIGEMNSSVKISNTTFRYCNIGIVAIGFPVPIETNEFIDVSINVVQYWKIFVKVVNENDDIITNGQVNLTSSYGNYTRRTLDENGTVDCAFIMVKEGDYDYNPFILRAGTHKDKDNETPHLTHESLFYIDKNYIENPKTIQINHTLSPDFSIRVISCNLSYMEVKETNKLSVWIRNMGEKTSSVEVKFSAIGEHETQYELIDTKVVNIPGTTLHPHHRVDCDWTPAKGGHYNVTVEIIPTTGTDPYPYDDNSPSDPIKVNVLESPTIDITKINGDVPYVGMINSGLITVQGTLDGSYDRIQIWINDDRWDHIFDFGLNLVKDLQDRNLSNEVKTAFKNNNYPLSSSAYILKIDDNTWEIIEANKNYRIKNASSHLNIYFGLFSLPYDIDYSTKTWQCKLDTGAFTGSNQIITANISGSGHLYYDESYVLVDLDNNPEIKINTPKNGKVLSANSENDKEYIGGFVWKVSPKAPDIKNIEFAIGGEKKNIIMENINETYKRWYYYWEITPEKDGNYVITSQCTDKDERISDIVEVTVTVNNNARYSQITIPKINIITPEPINSVEEQITINGFAEDDLELREIQVKVNNGNWKTIFTDIKTNTYYWEYIWLVKDLGKGVHSIYFRAIDEEIDENIIDDYYPIVSFEVTKKTEILPDLSIGSVIIKNKDGIETSIVNNSLELTIEINIIIQNSEQIPQGTNIFFKLKNGETTLGSTDKIINKNIKNSFMVPIPWTVYGEKGNYNITIEIDVGNALEEQDETNNIKIIEIEISDDPTSKTSSEEEEEDGSKFITIIMGMVLLSGIFFIILIYLQYKLKGMEKL